MKRLLLILATVAATASVLAACFPLAVGAVGGGALVAVDRRTSGAQLDDQAIEIKAASRIRDVYAYNVHVNVNAYNRRVLLTGSVPSETHRERIEQIVKEVENVREVFNELKVANSATLTERSSDGLLTARVKGALIEKSELSATAFKVTTERGTVYLMGLVTQGEADLAAETVRTVPGVQRVVRVLEIITEEQRQRGVPDEPSANNPAANPAKVNPSNAAPADDSYREGTGVTVTPVP